MMCEADFWNQNFGRCPVGLAFYEEQLLTESPAVCLHPET